MRSCSAPAGTSVNVISTCIQPVLRLGKRQAVRHGACAGRRQRQQRARQRERSSPRTSAHAWVLAYGTRVETTGHRRRPPPAPAVRERAVELSAALPPVESHGLRLDDEHLPHITLTQHFIRAEERERRSRRSTRCCAGQKPLRLAVTGGGRGQQRRLDGGRADAGAAATARAADGGAARRRAGRGDAGGLLRRRRAHRRRDVGLQLSRQRQLRRVHAAHHARPRGAAARRRAPMSFQPSIVAACHLGRFCTCREISGSWTL